MSLEEKINADIKSAMLSKNEGALRALRAIKSAILLAKTSGSGGLSTEDENKMLQKLVKQRKESVDIFEKQDRADLAKGEKEEIEVISKYLPEQMSEDDVRNEVKKVIATLGATSPADTGKVMGAVTKILGGKADNKLIASIVKESLSN